MRDFMETDNIYEQKKQVLERENELLGKITDAQAAVKNAVTKREWADFEAMLLSLNEYKEQFEVLETERLALFADAIPADLSSDSAMPHFYTMISHLPEDQRREMADVYRNIKERALKVRLANDALLLYLNEAKATTNAFLKAAFPERKGGVYSRQGKKVSSDMRSLVLDQVL
jgi:hypothetical protein